MNRYFLIIALVFTTLVSAQTKVGTINTDYIVTKMPEFKGVQEDLNAYRETLDASIKEKLDEYNAKVKDYTEKETTYTDALKQLKQKDIIKLEEDIQKLQQNSAKLYQVRQDEDLRPLYKKIGDEVEKIVQAEGFTHIFESNSNNLIYVSPEYDITLKVMKNLGIPTEDATPPTEN